MDSWPLLLLILVLLCVGDVLYDSVVSWRIRHRHRREDHLR